MVDGLVQDCSNSSALAMELLTYCTKPWIWCDIVLNAMWKKTRYINNLVWFIAYWHHVVLRINNKISYADPSDLRTLYWMSWNIIILLEYQASNIGHRMSQQATYQSKIPVQSP